MGKWRRIKIVLNIRKKSPKKDEPFFDVADALKKLEQKWIEKLQPCGERGYNK